MLIISTHAAGISCEGEIGFVGYSNGEASAGTDPEDAAIFARETGVDAMAVSVGNVHLQEQSGEGLDEGRISAIEAVTKVYFLKNSDATNMRLTLGELFDIESDDPPGLAPTIGDAADGTVRQIAYEREILKRRSSAAVAAQASSSRHQTVARRPSSARLSNSRSRSSHELMPDPA